MINGTPLVTSLCGYALICHFTYKMLEQDKDIPVTWMRWATLYVVCGVIQWFGLVLNICEAIVSLLLAIVCAPWLICHIQDIILIFPVAAYKLIVLPWEMCMYPPKHAVRQTTLLARQYITDFPYNAEWSWDLCVQHEQ